MQPYVRRFVDKDLLDRTIALVFDSPSPFRATERDYLGDE